MAAFGVDFHQVLLATMADLMDEAEQMETISKACAVGRERATTAMLVELAILLLNLPSDKTEYHVLFIKY